MIRGYRSSYMYIHVLHVSIRSCRLPLSEASPVRSERASTKQSKTGISQRLVRAMRKSPTELHPAISGSQDISMPYINGFWP